MNLLIKPISFFQDALKFSVCAVAAALFCVSAGAQSKRIILASTSTQHPYERPIWNETQAKAWFDAHSPIVGVNHPEPPCDAVTQDEALRRAAEIGFNSVRWWPDNGNFINSVENYAAIADKYGISCAPVFGFTHVPTSEADSAAMESKVREIIRHFRGDNRIIMWDIWNEPAWYGEDCPKAMEWIKIIARWCREEGCTQAITSSILWDAEISAASGGSYASARRDTEKEMDLHNFHDYAMQENHSANINYIINRYKKIDNRPLICTESLVRTCGSGVAMSLSEFSKHNIGFYTWGLFSNDANWDVRWGRSTFYAFEPIFHNLLYAGGDPVDERELSYIKNFRVQEGNTSVYPGKERTERWTKRRAWKWHNDEPVKGLSAASIAEAKELVEKHASDGVYNTMKVRLDYDVYKNIGSAALCNQIEDLAATAKNAKIKLIPVLITSDILNETRESLAKYAYNIIYKYYSDARFAGWCLFEQTTADEPSDYSELFAYLFSYVRYAFPNQPLFAAPQISSAQLADSTATDYVNTLWQLSDVVSFNMQGNSEANGSLLGSVMEQYQRPLYIMNAVRLQDEFAPYHVNWLASSEFNAEDVRNFRNSPLNFTKEGDNNKKPSWNAWAQVNRGAVKGLSYNSVEEALTGIPEKGVKGIYNSVRVRFDFKDYNTDCNQFMANFNAVLDSAECYGMTVLPSLLDDRYGTRNATVLQSFVADVVKTFNTDPRIAAWEIYNAPCAASQVSNSKMLNFIPQLFEAVRNVYPQRPVYVTPNVQTQTFAADFDYKSALVHGKRNGWSLLSHGKGSIDLTYLCWKLSDIVAYNSAQNAPELGWLNSVAYRFGRPVVCNKWETKSSTTIDATLDVFKDCHTTWYVDGTLDDDKAKDFAYQTIITEY